MPVASCRAYEGRCMASWVRCETSARNAYGCGVKSRPHSATLTSQLKGSTSPHVGNQGKVISSLRLFDPYVHTMVQDVGDSSTRERCQNAPVRGGRVAPARGRSCRPPHHDHSTVVRAVGLIRLHAQDRDRVEAPAASTPRQGGAALL